MIMKSEVQLLLYLSINRLKPIGGVVRQTSCPPEYRLKMAGRTGFKLLAPWGLSVWED